MKSYNCNSIYALLTIAGYVAWSLGHNLCTTSTCSYTAQIELVVNRLAPELVLLCYLQGGK